MQSIPIKRQRLLLISLWILLILALCFEISRDIFKDADFGGYINAGRLAWNHQNIYSDFLNTWPPFFSILAIPLAWMADFNVVLLRLIWQIGSIIALYFVIVKSIQLFYNQQQRLVLTFKDSSPHFSLGSAAVLVPFLISFRYILDNLSNIQINIYILLLCILAVHLFYTKKNLLLSAFLLALAISIKVYPIYLLFFLLFKREFVFSALCIGFILLLNLVCVVYFGYEQTLMYLKHWATEIVSHPPIQNHKNQSFYGMVFRMVNDGFTESGLHINFLKLSFEQAYKLCNAILVLGGLLIAWFFRLSFRKRSNKVNLIEFAFVLTAIPVISPLAWKAYFIFLFVGYFVAYQYLFEKKALFKPKRLRNLRILFFTSFALTVLSTDGVVGRKVALVLETYSVITIGSFLLLICLLLIHQRLIQREATEKNAVFIA